MVVGKLLLCSCPGGEFYLRISLLDLEVTGNFLIIIS